MERGKPEQPARLRRRGQRRSHWDGQLRRHGQRRECLHRQIKPDATLQGQALMDFAERTHFQSTPGDRPGVPLRDSDQGQQQLALALVATGLSEGGFTQTESHQTELVLRAQENSDDSDPLGYFLADSRDAGHERLVGMAVGGASPFAAFTIQDCARVATAPTFYGANPARSLAGDRRAGDGNTIRQGGGSGAPAGRALDMDATKRSQAIVADQLRDTRRPRRSCRPERAGCWPAP